VTNVVGIYTDRNCWNIYLASVYITYLGHPGEKTGKLSAKVQLLTNSDGKNAVWRL
jgi:hypothetical protein